MESNDLGKIKSFLHQNDLGRFYRYGKTTLHLILKPNSIMRAVNLLPSIKTMPDSFLADSIASLLKLESCNKIPFLATHSASAPLNCSVSQADLLDFPSV